MLLTLQKPSDIGSQQETRESGFMFALFFLAIILIPFQNSILQFTPLRFLGASPSFIPLLIFCVGTFIYRASSQGLRKPEVWMLVILFFSIIPTTWGLTVVDSGDLSKTFLIKKTVTNTILNVLLLYPAFVMPKPDKWIKRGVFISLFICIAGYLLVDVFSVGGIAYPSVFQSSAAVTTPRGFSLEQSTFGATITILALLSIVLAESKTGRVLLMGLLLLFVFVLTASKGTMIAAVGALGMAFMFSGKGHAGPKILGMVAVLTLGYLVSGKVTERFEGELQKSGSVSTRSILTLSTFPALVSNPLGVGYSGYTPTIIEHIYPTAQWLQSKGLQSAGTDEIDNYIDSEDKRALNIKSQIFEYIMVFGLPGLILIVMFHVKLYRRLLEVERSSRFYFVALYWFLLISLVTYMPALGMYVYTLAYGILLNANNAAPETALTKEQDGSAYRFFNLRT